MCVARGVFAVGFALLAEAEPGVVEGIPVQPSVLGRGGNRLRFSQEPAEHPLDPRCPQPPPQFPVRSPFARELFQP